MSAPLRLSGYREPLGLWVRKATRLEAHPALRVREFEFSSRGDRVPGRLLLPATGSGPHPLVMLQDAAGAAAATSSALATDGPWAAGGVAVASIDLPLHGARSDQKLLARLPAPGEPAPDPRRAALAFEFARQAVIDLERTLDALAAVEWIDAERIVYVGRGAAAAAGAAFCALDGRPCAAVLAFAEGGPGRPELDPAHHVPRIAPRPLLLVASESDADGSADALAAAATGAGSPVASLRCAPPVGGAEGAGELPPAVLEDIWDFAMRELGGPGPADA